MEFIVECGFDLKFDLVFDFFVIEVKFIDFKDVDSVDIIIMVENDEVEGG